MSLPKPDTEKENAALLQRFYLQSAARVLLPEERVAVCLRRPVPGKLDVEIWRAPDAGPAHYRNLITCGRVWQCAVCAAKITEARREQIRLVLDTTGLSPYLATFTLQHTKRDTLAVTLSMLIAAFAQFTSGKRWFEWRERFGVVGYVRALEVTYGKHGWHPHLHVLLMCDPHRADVLEIRGLLSQRWQRAVFGSGGYASWSAGFDLRASHDEIEDYVTKFGRPPRDITAYQRDKIDFEMTKAALKKGRRNGYSMTELLHAYCNGDQRAGGLWVEFVTTFKGRRMLEWSRSPDLRKLVGIEEDKTDEEVAAAHDEEAYLLARLSLTDWRLVVANDCRGEVLAMAREGDAEGIKKFLISLI